jgi:hypothetical protein
MKIAILIKGISHLVLMVGRIFNCKVINKWPLVWSLALTQIYFSEYRNTNYWTHFLGYIRFRNEKTHKFINSVFHSPALGFYLGLFYRFEAQIMLAKFLLGLIDILVNSKI